MSRTNHYDVTTWPIGDARADIGEVLNSIIDDIKRRQVATDGEAGGKPGAVIYIPPGDYRLRTQVLIDVSFLRIEGAGHGFTSSSIRFNVPAEEWGELHELWPGGSRILVDIPIGDGSEADGAAFLVERSGSPRISSVELSNFCIDGLHFVSDGSRLHPEHLRQRKDGHLRRECQRLVHEQPAALVLPGDGAARGVRRGARLLQSPPA